MKLFSNQQAWIVGGVFVFFMFLFGLFALMHQQVWPYVQGNFSLFYLDSYDFANYHLYNGEYFWHPRPNDWVPNGAYFFNNPWLDAMHVKLLSYSLGVGSFLWGAFEGLMGGILFLIGAKIFEGTALPRPFLENTGVALMTVIIAITAPTLLSEAGTFHSGDVVGVFFFLGWLCFVQGWSGIETRRKVFPILMLFGGFGFFLGIATAFKPTLYPFVLALPVVLAGWVVLGSRLGFRLIAVLSIGGGFLSGFFLVLGRQMWVLSHQFGNPIFPYFNSIFKSSWFQIGQGIEDFSYSVHGWGLFTLPFKFLLVTHFMVIEGPLRDWRFFLAFIAGVFLLVDFFKTKPRDRSFFQKNLVFIFCFCLLSYVIWAEKFGIYRYAFPLQVFSALLISGALIRFLTPLLGVSVLFLILTTLPGPFWGQKPYLLVTDFPQLPLNSMVLLPGETQSFWAVYLPESVSAVNPNFYPFHALYFSADWNGKIYFSLLRDQSSKSLVRPPILAHIRAHKPLFVLEDSYSIDRDHLIQPYQTGDLELHRKGSCYPLHYPFYQNPDRKVQLCRVVAEAVAVKN